MSTAALVSSSGVLRTVPAAPNITPESQKIARGLSEAFVGVAEFVKPSVVQIGVQRKVGTRGMVPFGPNMNPDDPHGKMDPKDLEEMFKKFFGPNGRPKFEKEQFGIAQGIGSGFIYDDKGHILTNHHVVEGAEKIVVSFNDGEEAPAKVIGTDPKTDVAVIKVEVKDYPALPRGRSSSVKVGELVFAVGSPFGLEQTVTTGIISALGRTSNGSNRVIGQVGAYEDFLQTDAAINQGNSGGPLVDVEGRVIGINSAIVTSSRASAGVGFAIPIDMASNIADRLIKDGKVNRAAIGIALQPLSPAMLKSFGYDPKSKGVLVGDVIPDSPAAKAGLRQGDIITKFDDHQALAVPSFRNYVATSDLAKPHTLTYIREGKTLTAQIKLEAAEKVLAQAEKVETPKSEEKKVAEPTKVELGDFGLEVQELSPELGKPFGFAKETKGLLIGNVKEDSPASAAGLTPGLVITKIVKDKRIRPIETAKQFRELTEKSDEVSLYVTTPEGGRFVTLTKPH